MAMSKAELYAELHSRDVLIADMERDKLHLLETNRGQLDKLRNADLEITHLKAKLREIEVAQMLIKKDGAE